MSVLFHQLFQSESWKLYRNLGVFSLAFAAEDHALTILGMLHTLSGTKRAAACGLVYRDLWPGKLLAARGKELRNVIDGVVARTVIAVAPGPGLNPGTAAALIALALIVCRALVFIFVAVVALAVVGFAMRR